MIPALPLNPNPDSTHAPTPVSPDLGNDFGEALAVPKIGYVYGMAFGTRRSTASVMTRHLLG